jgi:hypothetical protein
MALSSSRAALAVHGKSLMRTPAVVSKELFAAAPHGRNGEAEI